jgi:hypothetical protein
VYRQLSLLYAWYASSRAAYLEQVRSDGLALGWGVLPSRFAWPVVLLLQCSTLWLCQQAAVGWFAQP